MNPGYLYDHLNHPGNNPANNPPPPLSASSLHYMYNPVEMVARHITPFQQGLSLSLSSQQSRYRSQADDGRAAVTGDGVVSGVLLNSKYVKVTQEILEEVVNVGKLGVNNSDQSTKKLKKEGESLPVNGEDKTIKSGDLSTGERQEINMKKAKLVNMLDEVEQRYRQYHQQMQIVISWFEQAAGIGSANSYTSLALQTISKQFRCLKDEITEQIKTARRSLGEEDGSQMKFVDKHFRLQQLGMGMIQHNNAWRPQRGLPERSVSVLRAWLFQHFLHPYPKDLDKTMLAKQTGLTRSQVSNWFINARVRLWKPMVEEMYLEEVKVQERNGKEDDKSTKIDQNEKQEKIESPENLNFRPTKQENTFNSTQFQNPSGFSLMGSLEMDEITQFSPKKPQNNDVGFTITAGNSTDFMTRLGGYSIGDQFQQPYSGNGRFVNFRSTTL